MDNGEFPLAYHITWGTYGTRLHGDRRGTVRREASQFDSPIIGRIDKFRNREIELLRFAPRLLDRQRRSFVESAIPEVCRRGKWKLIDCAAAPDHIHCLLRAQADGQEVRKWLKRWIGQALSSRWPLQPGQTWWAEGGSVKWIFDERYLESAKQYVSRQRTLKT
jgi:REP element-mobilizing transposase RayT